MPSLLKSLKSKLQGALKADSSPHRDEELSRDQDRRRSLSGGSTRSSDSGRSRDAGYGSRSQSRHTQEPVTTSEPLVGPTRNERAKNDEWDHVYDDPKRRHTDSPTREKSGVKIGPMRISYSPPWKSGKSTPKFSRDLLQLKDDPRRSRGLSITSPRSSHYHPRRSNDLHLHISSLRSSKNHVKSRDERSRGSRSRSRELSKSRDISSRRSTDHHHRRRRKSSHPKELSRHGSHYQSHHRSSNGRIIRPIPPIPPTREIFVVNKKCNQRSERERRKEAERFQADRDRLRREKEDRENRKRRASEYNERQKERAAKRAAKAARQEMEEETVRKRGDRLAKEGEDAGRAKVEQEKQKDRERRERETAARSPTPKQNLPRLTAENLRAAAGSDDFVDGEKTSSLNRPFGDMTRTFLEGMVPSYEVKEAQRRKMEKRLREAEEEWVE